MPGAKTSFMKSLFNGSINETLLHHYPFYNTPREDDFRLMHTSIEDWLKGSVDAMKFDDEKKLPKEVIQGMKDMGLFGLIIPEIYGGSEFTQTFYTRTLELTNTHDASLTLTYGAHQSIGLKGLYLYGTEAQKKKYMPLLSTGELIAAFALTEPGAGSDAAGLKSRIVREGDHYVLNGAKLWITNGGFANFFTVFAKETIDGEEKITALMVTRDMGDVTHGPEEQKLGIKASSTVEVIFKDVRVPVENVLGKPGDGFKIAMGILNQGRLGLAGGALGAIKSVLEQSIVYAKNRKAFGHAISDFGLIQDMLTEMTCHTYAVEAMTYLTTSFVDNGDMDYSLEAAICKVYGTEAAWTCLNLAMQIHGGNGYMKDYGLERKLRDARIGIIFEGTNEILRLFIALTGIKEPASEYKRIGKELQSLQNVRNLDSLNDAIGRIGVISEFAFAQMKQNVSTERVEGFHDVLSKEAERLSTAAKTLSNTAGKLIRQYGQKLMDEQIQLARLADIAIDTFMIAAVLSRVNSVVEKHGGPEKNAQEIALAQLIIRNAKARINQNAYNTKANRDEDVKSIATHVTSVEKYPFDLANYK
ncbi:MAG: acyl-CoA dehydrogenase family protein [Silvanigrellales bacterium]|jgi:acyl-CoA dehydrogenase family protein 9|nr:acyl-CoA dehydrogenase family protein [Silvanigrellales bacterium]